MYLVGMYRTAYLILIIFYSKLINFAVPETIDDRAINTGKKVSIFKKHENLSLAINSAKVLKIAQP